MERYEIFMKYYNQIEDFLRREVGGDKYTTFSEGINIVAKRNTHIQRRARELRDYANLRNVLVHQHTETGKIIAEPTDEAIQEFGTLVNAIINPITLSSLLQPTAHVGSFTPDEPLAKALKQMKEHDYSQVVIQNNGRLTLLTVEGVARWLEEQIEKDLISVQDATIEEALRYERPDCFKVMSKKNTIEEVLDIFTQAIERKQPRIYAILITANGKATEKSIGILTPWDLLSKTNK